jgi:hypothetical protein
MLLQKLSELKFTSADSTLIRPFTFEETHIYSSEGTIKNDTITFSLPRSSFSQTRSLEQGFYNTKGVSVRYAISAGSYHSMNVEDANSHLHEEIFCSITRDTNDTTASMDVEFLGLSFSGWYVDSLAGLKDSVIVFHKNRSDNQSMEGKKAIRQIFFDKSYGVVGYKDYVGRLWKRKGISFND